MSGNEELILIAVFVIKAIANSSKKVQISTGLGLQVTGAMNYKLKYEAINWQ